MELDLAFVDETLERLGRKPDRILPVLQVLQRHYRYLPGEALRRVAQQSDITLAQIASVSTFYSQFRHRPVGRHLISVCNGTACHVKRSADLCEAIQRRLRLRPGRETTSDMLFTVETVNCLGACGLAPAMLVNDKVFGRLAPEGALAIIDEIIRKEAGNESGDPPA